MDLNAAFQRIARRDKVFLSEQCKETEEYNRMGKARDLLKKLEILKEYFMKNSHNKGQKQNNLTGGKNTRKNCTKKILMTQRS